MPPFPTSGRETEERARREREAVQCCLEGHDWRVWVKGRAVCPSSTYFALSTVAVDVPFVSYDNVLWCGEMRVQL